jgi:hypothetical protein
MRSISLRTNGEELGPFISKRWNSILLSSLVIKAGDEDDIILHDWGESRTLQRSLPNALQEHASKVGVLTIAVVDTINKESQ